jgi:DEAD/DEAH box helicase domain-containing protein
MTLYEGAIYLVQARPYQVEKLDWAGRKAFVRQTKADYYTDAIDYTRLKVLDQFEEDRRSAARCARGEVHLVRRVAGYKKIRYYTHENVGYGNVRLPDHEMHSTAVWWQMEPGRLEALLADRWTALDGFLGAAHAMHLVAALLSMAERRDLGRAVGDSMGSWVAATGLDGHGQIRSERGEPLAPEALADTFRPTLFLYDNYPGGVGLSTPLYDLRDQVVARAYELVAGCRCRHGCPACIGPVLATDEQGRHSPKAAALTVLGSLGGILPEAEGS